MASGLHMRALLATVLCLTLLFANPARTEIRGVAIEGGVFTPLYGLKQEDERVQISAFRIDDVPVTVADFKRFIAAHPEWSKSKAQSLLVDEKYLMSLSNQTVSLNSPITEVSYFAAAEYCAWRGGRLPTTNEWEYVAAADEHKKNASRDPEFVQRLLAWYTKPHGSEGLGEIRSSAPNAWGVFDLHGLIWEWTQDYNSVFVSSDNRRENDQLKNLFCGVGAVSANDKSNYAAFMRYALRSSLQGRYTMENLGFRCAYDQ